MPKNLRICFVVWPCAIFYSPQLQYRTQNAVPYQGTVQAVLLGRALKQSFTARFPRSGAPQNLNGSSTTSDLQKGSSLTASSSRSYIQLGPQYATNDANLCRPLLPFRALYFLYCTPKNRIVTGVMRSSHVHVLSEDWASHN